MEIDYSKLTTEELDKILNDLDEKKKQIQSERRERNKKIAQIKARKLWLLRNTPNMCYSTAQKYNQDYYDEETKQYIKKYTKIKEENDGI